MKYLIFKQAIKRIGGCLLSRKKVYEEKQRHGTAELPIDIHKMEYPEGTDAIFYLHWHQEFEFLVVTNGNIIFNIEDREYKLHTGDGVFINSNFLHSARAEGYHACSFMALDFSYQFLHEDIHSSFAKRFITPVLNGKILFREFLEQGNGWQDIVLSMLLEAGACPGHELYNYELMIRSRIFGVWDLMNSNSVRVKREDSLETRYSERLAPVIKYIKKNYAYDITLSELAGLLPMSEGQFSRVFKQTMKLSPVQYLMRYRILQSCQLLRDTDKKIGEVANLSGFNNISYFNRVFLQTIGCTPKEYRAMKLE